MEVETGMKVLADPDKNSAPQGYALLAAAVTAFAPACYTPSWVPWLRWVGAVWVVAVAVIVVRLIAGLVAWPLPLPGVPV